MFLNHLPKKLINKSILISLTFLLLTPFLFFVLSPNGDVQAASDIQILPSTWTLTGNNGSREESQSLSSSALQGHDTLKLTYNLHGLKLLPGDASAIIFEQPSGNWHYISLSNYGQNGYNGSQTVSIPLSDFPGLNLSQPATTFHVRFWDSGAFTVDLTSAILTTTQDPQITPTPILTTTSLLNSAWSLSGNNGAAEKSQTISADALQGKTAFNLTYNLHGLKLLPGDASAIIFEQPSGSWHYISLSNYGQNGYNGSQTVSIPLSDFPELNLSQPATTFHVRFWSSGAFTVDLTSAYVSGSNSNPAPINTPTPTQTPTPTPVPAQNKSWAIQSVSSMKETKDKICSQDSQSYINSWVSKAKELGVTHIAVETPYENPSCGNSVSYSKAWIGAIRAQGLKIWHRHMSLSFEGIYDTPKNNTTNYLTTISNYIKNNASDFQEGDIFTPAPEPQNGGISGITYCNQGICMFNNAAHFNQWLRDSMTASDNAFTSIGLGGKIKTGYFGFDGFVAWGHNNPDWNGILEDATIAQMGNIAIDHYPELINDTMENGLKQLEARYPGVKVFISEWGSAGTTSVEQQVLDTMGTVKRHPNIVGFNYWHMGMGGNEALINSDFTSRSQFDEVQSFFKGLR